MQRVFKMYAVPVVVVCLASGWVATARAQTVPFTEDFNVDSANWFDVTAGSPIGWSATGGPDGGSFAETSFSFLNSEAGNSVVLFRGQDEFGSSGGAFAGDWIDSGVTEFTTLVRHDAAVPLSFFARMSGPFNFPGATAISFVPVAPGVWTELSFLIDPTSPQFVTFEGSDFATVFGNVGHVQVGVSTPDALAGVDQTITFGLDKASIVPEPASIALLLAGASFGLVRGRRRRA